jgi:excisionase family DNA binding protein
MDDRLLEAPELADILGVRVHRVYELARLGIIPAVKIGRQVRFSPKRIRDFIENGGQGLPGGWRREA